MLRQQLRRSRPSSLRPKPQLQSLTKPHHCPFSSTSASSSSYRNHHPPDLKPLKGARCVITGASNGIGRAIAQDFARKGARCLLIGRDETRLNDTFLSCTLPSDPNLLFHNMKIGDISKREFWTTLNLKDLLPAELSTELPSEFTKQHKQDYKRDPISSNPHPHGVDILVNAAGITHSSLLLTTSPSLIESTIQTNLMGTLWASQILGKQMLRQKSGVVVNVASLLAVQGGAGAAAYAASKAGVVGLTRSLAAELGARGVRVNAVLPGYVESDMTRGMFAFFLVFFCVKIGLGAWGRGVVSL